MSTPGTSAPTVQGIMDCFSDVGSFDESLNHFHFGTLDDPTGMPLFPNALDLDAMASPTAMNHPNPGHNIMAQDPVGHQPKDLTLVYLPMATGGTTSAQEAEAELELAIHFMEIAFSDMVPQSSYRTLSMRQKSWVMYFMARSPAFKAAALSMSAYHSRQDIETSNRYKTQAKAALEALPEDGPPVLNESFPSKLFAEKFICSVQIQLLDVS